MEKEASILLHATEKHDVLWFVSCTRHEVLSVWFEKTNYHMNEVHENHVLVS